MRRINIKSYDHGFLTEMPITAQVREGVDLEDVAFCNHAGAESNVAISQYYSPAQNDVVDVESVIDECDKCHAYRFRHTCEWINAPAAGAHS